SVDLPSCRSSPAPAYTLTKYATRRLVDTSTGTTSASDSSSKRPVAVRVTSLVAELPPTWKSVERSCVAANDQRDSSSPVVTSTPPHLSTSDLVPSVGEKNLRWTCKPRLEIEPLS